MLLVKGNHCQGRSTYARQDQAKYQNTAWEDEGSCKAEAKTHLRLVDSSITPREEQHCAIVEPTTGKEAEKGASERGKIHESDSGRTEVVGWPDEVRSLHRGHERQARQDGAVCKSGVGDCWEEEEDVDRLVEMMRDRVIRGSYQSHALKVSLSWQCWVNP